MSDPLAHVFDQFLKKRVYLKAVSPKTEVWYRTAFKAFQSSQGEGFSKARVQAMNAFGLWLDQERGEERVRLALLRAERRVTANRAAF